MSHPLFVDFDPIAFRIGPVFGFGPLPVHWYGIMYLLAFTVAWALGERRRRMGRLPVSREAFGDLAFYAMMGVIIGGRLGYMFFYVPLDWIWTDPLALLRLLQGGMSFHGGLLGVLIAALWWSRRHHLHFFDTMDFVAPVVPIGLGLGRLGNFINGELWGKTTDLPWGMLFPHALQLRPQFARTSVDQLRRLHDAGLLDAYARHPSQLYEVGLEGVVLFIAMWLYSATPRPRYAVSGMFALLYGCFRFLIEFVRVPDVQLGYLAFGWVTMGQILSLPLIIIGLFLLWRSRGQPVLVARNETVAET